MSIIESDKVEIEVQEQTDPDSFKYMIKVSYEGHNKSKELAKILLTDEKPIIKKTIDRGNIVLDVKDN